jgi:hypothetical protein
MCSYLADVANATAAAYTKTHTHTNTQRFCFRRIAATTT